MADATARGSPALSKAADVATSDTASRAGDALPTRADGGAVAGVAAGAAVCSVTVDGDAGVAATAHPARAVVAVGLGFGVAAVRLTTADHAGRELTCKATNMVVRGSVIFTGFGRVGAVVAAGPAVLQLGEVRAAAVAARVVFGAGIAAGAAMIDIALDVDAGAATTASASRAGVAAGAAIVPVTLQVDAFAVAVCRTVVEAANLTDRDAFSIAANFVEPADVTAGAAVVPVTLQVDARTTTGLTGATGDAARSAVLTVGLEICARAVATGLGGSTGDVAVSTVLFISVEVVALTLALIAPGLALAFAALAGGAIAAVAIPVTVLPDFVAGGGQLLPTRVNHRRSKGAGKEGLQRASARGCERSRQIVKSRFVHVSSDPLADPGSWLIADRHGAPVASAPQTGRQCGRRTSCEVAKGNAVACPAPLQSAGSGSASA
jgi:hypothetical protein